MVVLDVTSSANIAVSNLDQNIALYTLSAKKNDDSFDKNLYFVGVYHVSLHVISCIIFFPKLNALIHIYNISIII